MNPEYSPGLLLLDFVPNIAFLIGAFFLVKIAAIAGGRPCSRLVMGGALLIVVGGVLKAIWKLMYASGGPDVRWMSEVQFILVAPGFLALVIAVILMARKQAPPPATPMLALAIWKIPFLAVMTVTSLGAHGILAFIAFRRKSPLAAAGFIVAFLGVLALGGMASAQQTVTLQWFEESINSVGQLGFMMGSILLHHNYKTFGCS